MTVNNTVVTSSNLIQGPATLYLGLFGAAEPALITAAAGVAFTDVGGTRDGVTIGFADEYSVLEVDQVIYEVGRVRTKRVITVATSMAEATLDNLALAINNSAPAAGVLEGDDGPMAFRPGYRALLLDGLAPGGQRRRIIVRKVLQTENVEAGYMKDGQMLFPVTFTGHWVSTSVKPFKITDEALV